MAPVKTNTPVTMEGLFQNKTNNNKKIKTNKNHFIVTRYLITE